MEERVVVVQLRRILVHDLAGDLEGIVVLQLGLDLVVGVLVRVLLDEQVLDRAVADGGLVDGEARGELAVLAEPDLLEQVHGEVLAVVVDEVVCGALFAHVEDDHLAWGGSQVSATDGAQAALRMQDDTHLLPLKPRR